MALGKLLLLALPLRLERPRLLPETSDLNLDFLQPLPARGIVLLLKRLLLDLELHEATLDLVDLCGNAIDLDPQARGGLIHEVHRLVRQEPLADVAVGKRCRRDERRIANPHAVVEFVALLETAKNGHRVRNRGLVDQDRLEAPLERGVLLHVLAVLIERGGPDAAEIAPRQLGLQEVRGIHSPLRLAGPDKGVKLVHEEDDAAFGGGHLLEEGLEAVLKLAAVLRAGDHRTEVHRDKALVLQPLRHIPRHDAAREALHDRGLAHARLPDEDGVIFRAARKHLHHPPDLVVASDYGIDLPLARGVGEVAAVAFERLKLFFRVLVRHLLVPAQFLQRLEERDLVHPHSLEQPGGIGLAMLDDPQKEVVGAHILVPQPLGLFLGLEQDGIDLRREHRLDAVAGGLRLAIERRVEKRLQAFHIRAQLLEEGTNEPLLLLEKGGQQVLGS